MRITKVLYSLLLISFTLAATAEESSDLPPMPPGFESAGEAMQAVLSGKVAAIQPPSPLPDSIVEEKGIVYCERDEKEMKLDLYYPKDLKEPVPGMICIHGGGWSKGNRNDYKFYSILLAEEGYVAATISYRLSGEAKFPAAVEDCKAAVRWMRANAEKYHIDPERIGVIGGSAGGHLSLMVGYSSDVPELDGEGCHLDPSSRVQAVVNFYGPTDLTTEYARNRGEVTGFLGEKSYDKNPKPFEMASPLHHLTKDDPPTLTFHGTIDELVPLSQAERLHEKLDELGIPNVYDPFPGWPHAMDIAKPVNDRCVYQIKRFLAEHLKKDGD